MVTRYIFSRFGMLDQKNLATLLRSPQPWKSKVFGLKVNYASFSIDQC
jgi:hypothetical protein